MQHSETGVTIYINKKPSLPGGVYEGEIILTVDQALTAWLEAKFLQSESVRTKQTYEKTIQDFRTHLRARGQDLDSDRKIVSDLAGKWANSSQSGKQISASTWKQRLAILSSFYSFAIKREVLDRHNQPISFNPIERIERKRTGQKQAAKPIESDDLKALLAKIDRSTLEGMRDYVLLQIALNTGHRAGELVGLRLGHLHFDSTGGCLIEWVRCKGNKQMGSSLGPKVTHALKTYLTAVYPNLKEQPKDAPVWVSFSKRNKGHGIGYQTIREICKAYLGTSKVHTTRHSAVVIMMEAGANMEQLRQFTGHNDIKELATYIEKLKTYSNPYRDKLEEAFCLD